MLREHLTQEEVNLGRNVYYLDVSGLSWGRAASFAARILNGNLNQIYSGHNMLGDYLVIMNFDKICLTGKKSREKKWFRFSGNSLKTFKYDLASNEKKQQLFKYSLLNMLPKNRLRKFRIERISFQTEVDIIESKLKKVCYFNLNLYKK